MGSVDEAAEEGAGERRPRRRITSLRHHAQCRGVWGPRASRAAGACGCSQRTCLDLLEAVSSARDLQRASRAGCASPKWTRRGGAGGPRARARPVLSPAGRRQRRCAPTSRACVMQGPLRTGPETEEVAEQGGGVFRPRQCAGGRTSQAVRGVCRHRAVVHAFEEVHSSARRRHCCFSAAGVSTEWSARSEVPRRFHHLLRFQPGTCGGRRILWIPDSADPDLEEGKGGGGTRAYNIPEREGAPAAPPRPASLPFV